MAGGEVGAVIVFSTNDVFGFGFCCVVIVSLFVLRSSFYYKLNYLLQIEGLSVIIFM